MSDDLSVIKQSMGESTQLDYKVAFLLHLIKTNQLIPELTRNGISHTELLCVYVAIVEMDGMIQGGRASDEYMKNIDKMLADLEENELSPKKLSGLDDGEKIFAFFKLLRIWKLQEIQMKYLGLTPPTMYTDIMPKFEIIQDKPWIPEEGSFDYKQSEVPATSEGTSAP